MIEPSHDHELERRCNHERSHVIDSAFHRGGYSTPESRRIFCDVCRMQRWLDIEVALALCQAELDLIPYEAANRIERAAHIEHLDQHQHPHHDDHHHVDHRNHADRHGYYFYNDRWRGARWRNDNNYDNQR